MSQFGRRCVRSHLLLRAEQYALSLWRLSVGVRPQFQQPSVCHCESLECFSRSPAGVAQNGNPSGFVAWPPHGAVPSWTLQSSSLFYWSFGTIESASGLFNSVTVTINNQPAVNVQVVYSLCDGAGMPEASGGARFVWIKFRNAPLYIAPATTYTVVVQATGNGVKTWSYTMWQVDCANLGPAPPTPPPAAMTPAPTPPPAVCGNGIREGSEQCDVVGGDSCCQNCVFKSAGSVCRFATGLCDQQETCSGFRFVDFWWLANNLRFFSFAFFSFLFSVVLFLFLGSGTCPPDSFMTGGTQCRAASPGGCDVAEYCTGVSKTCPNDAYRSAGTVCRASASVCDVQETCTGNSPNCAPDQYAPAGVECRAAAGPCDVPESCSGSSPTCPTNLFKSQWTLCPDGQSRAVLRCWCCAHAVRTGFKKPGMDCDDFDFCDGVSAFCPPMDRVRAAGQLCRPSVGPCDMPETVATLFLFPVQPSAHFFTLVRRCFACLPERCICDQHQRRVPRRRRRVRPRRDVPWQR